jgi:hypothetical protein
MATPREMMIDGFIRPQMKFHRFETDLIGSMKAQGKTPTTDKSHDANRVNQLNQPPPVKTQNKAAKNAVISPVRTGGTLSDLIVQSQRQNFQRPEPNGKQAYRPMQEGTIIYKNPSVVRAHDGETGKPIKKPNIGPVGKLPGALGMLDVANTANAIKALRGKNWKEVAEGPPKDL